MARATAEQLEFFSNQTLDQVEGKNPNVKLNEVRVSIKYDILPYNGSSELIITSTMTN